MMEGRTKGKGRGGEEREERKEGGGGGRIQRRESAEVERGRKKGRKNGK